MDAPGHARPTRAQPSSSRTSPPWASPRDQPVPAAGPATADPSPPPRPWWRSVVALAVLAAAAVAVLLVVVVRDDVVAVAALEVGDCTVGVPFDGGVVHEVRRVDCASAHEAEVYAVTTLEGAATWPGADEVLARARRQCTAAATGLLDGAGDDWSIVLLHPSRASWERGDRVVTCLVTAADGAETTGSVAG